MFVKWVVLIGFKTVDPCYFLGNTQTLPDPGLSGQDAFHWFSSGIHSYAFFRMDNMK